MGRKWDENEWDGKQNYRVPRTPAPGSITGRTQDDEDDEDDENARNDGNQRKETDPRHF